MRVKEREICLLDGLDVVRYLRTEKSGGEEFHIVQSLGVPMGLHMISTAITLQPLIEAFDITDVPVFDRLFRVCEDVAGSETEVFTPFPPVNDYETLCDALYAAAGAHLPDEALGRAVAIFFEK